MTTPVATVLESDADVRWRQWEARGARNDRRLAKRMRRLMLVVAAVLVAWLAVVIA